MSDQETMTLGAAIGALGKLDAIYYELYLELSNLRGELPCGQPGMCGYDNLKQVLAMARKRKEQIEQIKQEIEQERNRSGDEVVALRSLFAEFDIKV